MQIGTHRYSPKFLLRIWNADRENAGEWSYPLSNLELNRCTMGEMVVGRRALRAYGRIPTFKNGLTPTGIGRKDLHWTNPAILVRSASVAPKCDVPKRTETYSETMRGRRRDYGWCSGITRNCGLLYVGGSGPRHRAREGVACPLQSPCLGLPSGRSGTRRRRGVEARGERASEAARSVAQCLIEPECLRNACGGSDQVGLKRSGGTTERGRQSGQNEGSQARFDDRYQVQVALGCPKSREIGTNVYLAFPFLRLGRESSLESRGQSGFGPRWGNEVG
ncbi:hypothetical protein B0H11DRAFT_1906978 [Mycena galericulata]|nr:hypothetical protein B0H11DRAFT_1906978 [Mycena galericulata]